MDAHGDITRETREYRGYTISIAAEHMDDGAWAAVARAVYETATGREIFRVPSHNRRFPSEQEAREHASRWRATDRPQLPEPLGCLE